MLSITGAAPTIVLVLDRCLKGIEILERPWVEQRYLRTCFSGFLHPALEYDRRITGQLAAEICEMTGPTTYSVYSREKGLKSYIHA